MFNFNPLLARKPQIILINPVNMAPDAAERPLELTTLENGFEGTLKTNEIDYLKLDDQNVLVFDTQYFDLDQTQYLWRFEDGYEIAHAGLGLIVGTNNASTTWSVNDASNWIAFCDRLSPLNPWGDEFTKIHHD